MLAMKKPNDIRPSSFCVLYVHGNRSEKCLKLKLSMSKQLSTQNKALPKLFLKVLWGEKRILLGVHITRKNDILCIFFPSMQCHMINKKENI